MYYRRYKQDKMKKTLTLLLILSSAFCFAQMDTTATLPDVNIKDMNGKDINISDYGKNGKITIISFWATWCKPCIKELKNVNALLEEWQEDYDVELVAVSVDDSRNSVKVKPMVNALNWDFDILMDPNGDLQRALNVANPPVTFLIDQKGNIVYTHTGYVEGDEYGLEDHIKEISEKESEGDKDSEDEDEDDADH
jgi:peroxiredoxin